MENKKRKKWNGYLAAGLFMTGLAVFLGILGYFWTPYSTTAMSAAEKFTAPSCIIFLEQTISEGIFFQE